VSLFPEKKQILKNDADVHIKQYGCLPYKKKARLIDTNIAQRHEHMAEEDRKLPHELGQPLLLSMKKLILINQLLNFSVNIFTRIQHWH
jgi:hypothetical protein